MFRRTSLLVVALAACGGAEHPDTPVEPADTAPTCPSDAAPERCRELAQSAASSGNTSGRGFFQEFVENGKISVER